MSLPDHQRRAQGVWDAFHCPLYWRQAGDNFSVCGKQANPRLVYGKRAEKGIGTATVMVGAEDVPGRQTRGQSRQIKAPWSGRWMAFGAPT